jgi:hypothetical protein
MGTNTPKPNRSSRTNANQKLVDGLNKHQSVLASMVVNGVPLTAAQAVSKLDEIIAAADLAVTARAAWLAAVTADITERTSTATFVAGVRQAILVAFHGQVDVLADFGLTTRKAVVRTPEQKQEAAAKAKATRAARHTMGKNKKALITGASVSAGAAASPPATAPAASPGPAPAAAPAPNAAAPTPAAPAAPVVPPSPQQQ